MAELMSALRGHLSAGRFGLEGTAGVTLSEIHPFSLTQISAWPDSLQAAEQEAARLAGCNAAPAPGQAHESAAGTLLRVEPLKWWLIGRDTPTDLPSLAAETGAVLDLSSSRTWIRLGGPRRTDLLNRFLPLNLSEKAFPSGSSASTAFHHIGVTLWRDEEHFNVLLPRSFAASLWEMLTESAAQFGAEVV